MKQTFLAIWESTGAQPEELADHPESPPHFPWVWDWFMDFPSPITWSEINSWSEISLITPSRWEGELLISLDRLRK